MGANRSKLSDRPPGVEVDRRPLERERANAFRASGGVGDGQRRACRVAEQVRPFGGRVLDREPDASADRALDHVVEADRPVDRAGIHPLEDVDRKPTLEKAADDASIGTKVEDRQVVDDRVDDHQRSVPFAVGADGVRVVPADPNERRFLRDDVEWESPGIGVGKPHGAIGSLREPSGRPGEMVIKFEKPASGVDVESG